MSYYVGILFEINCFTYNFRLFSVDFLWWRLLPNSGACS